MVEMDVYVAVKTVLGVAACTLFLTAAVFAMGTLWALRKFRQACA